MSPKLLLLDEPMAALDRKLREETRLELIGIQQRLGTTFLVVTHDQPIRYLHNALAGADPVFGPMRAVPNGVPYAYDDEQLARGSERLERYAAENG